MTNNRLPANVQDNYDVPSKAEAGEPDVDYGPSASGRYASPGGGSSSHHMPVSSHVSELLFTATRSGAVEIGTLSAGIRTTDDAFSQGSNYKHKEIAMQDV
jgi:hypothetical protein